MTNKLGKAVASSVVVLGLLAGAGIASAQVYDTGAQASGSPGTIIPSTNTSVGITGPVIPASTASTPGGTSGSGSPGVPNTGGTGARVTPGVPNTGAGDPAVLIVLAVTGLIAAAGGAYLARQRYSLR